MKQRISTVGGAETSRKSIPGEGWLCLATVIDLDSRRVMGHLRTDLVEQALRNAITQHRPEARVIFHSDRGCQHTSGPVRPARMRQQGRLSIGCNGHCRDNAAAESFFATIETELLDRQPWPTNALAHKAILEYIDGWYNTHRRHFSLGHLSSAAYEATHETAAEIAVA